MQDITSPPRCNFITFRTDTARVQSAINDSKQVQQIEAVPSARQSKTIATSQALPESVRNHFQMQTDPAVTARIKTNLNADGKIGAKNYLVRNFQVDRSLRKLWIRRRLMI